MTRFWRVDYKRHGIRIRTFQPRRLSGGAGRSHNAIPHNPTMPKASLSRRSLLPIAFFLACGQLCGQAQAQSVDLDRGVAGNASVDGVDCITADTDPEQSPEATDSFSDSTTEGSEQDNMSADRADMPKRLEHHSYLAGITFEGVTRSSSRTMGVPAYLVRCFYCQHEHIRERAPPVIGINI